MYSLSCLPLCVSSFSTAVVKLGPRDQGFHTGTNTVFVDYFVSQSGNLKCNVLVLNRILLFTFDSYGNSILGARENDFSETSQKKTF